MKNKDVYYEKELIEHPRDNNIPPIKFKKARNYRLIP